MKHPQVARTAQSGLGKPFDVTPMQSKSAARSEEDSQLSTQWQGRRFADASWHTERKFLDLTGIMPAELGRT